MPSSTAFPVSDGLTQVTALGLVLATLFVPGRLASNLRMQRSLYLDDYVAVAGYVLFVTYAGLCFGIDAYARYYQAPNSWDATATFFLKTIYAAEALASPASLVAKGSILLLYVRIFNPSPILRQSVVVVTGIALVVSLPNLPLFSFYCAPNATTTTWEPSIAGTCATVNLWAALQQVVDAVINLAMFLLPLPSIFRLQLSLKRRLLLAFVLMHGIFALAASVICAFYRIRLARLSVDDPAAALWLRTAAFTAFGVELSMTLVTGSMHACWGYLRAKHARYRTQKGSRSVPYNYGSRMPGVSDGSYTKRAAELEESSGSDSSPELERGDHPVDLQDSARRIGLTGPQASPGVAGRMHSRGGEKPKLIVARKAIDASTYSHYPHSESDLDYPTLRGHAGRAPSLETSRRDTQLYAPSSTNESSTQQSSSQRSSSTRHARRVLMSEIEAAVSSAGKARLVVGSTRPGSENSVDSVDVRQSPDISPRKTGTHYASASSSTTPAAALYRTLDHPPREYVVERAGDEYIVSRAPRLGAEQRMGIRRDVCVEVSESLSSRNQGSVQGRRDG